MLRSSSLELVFTFEEPEVGALYYLDLCLMVSRGLCWPNRKESPKSVLPASSIHPRSVKRGVVTSLVSNALRRSCVHQVAFSLAIVLQFPLTAGYSRVLISSVAFKILKKSIELAVPCERGRGG